MRLRINNFLRKHYTLITHTDIRIQLLPFVLTSYRGMNNKQYKMKEARAPDVALMRYNSDLREDTNLSF